MSEKILKTLIKEICLREKNIEDLTNKEFKTLLEKLCDLYFNKGKSVEDDVYDYLLELYSKKFGKYTRVGSKIDSHKVTLPKKMGSLDKVKTEKEIRLWTKKNSGPYIITDKLDGVSVLYYNNNLASRGDGLIGTNISFLLDYIDLPRIKNVIIRGELIMKKEDFEEYNDEYSNIRNMVVGLINPDSKSRDKNKLSKLHFVSYEFDSNEENISQKEQLKILNSIGFETPFSIETSDVSEIKLKEILTERKNKSKYVIDGIVVTDNITRRIDIERMNPENSVAFKMIGQIEKATVEYVEWNVGKHNTLIPRIKINPVIIDDCTINWTSGFNAKFIVDNGIGKGSEIMIIRSGDVIPYVKEVITSVEPELPKCEFKWNETGINIYCVEENDEHKKRRIVEFFKCLDAKFLGESTIEKLYNQGINTLKKMFNVKKEELLKLEGIKEKSAERILKTIENSITNKPIHIVAAASGIFDNGFGVKKLKLIFEQYPDILEDEDDEEELIEKIKGIKGIDTQAKQFVNNIENFKIFLDTHREIKIEIIEDIEIVFSDEEEHPLKNKTIVFTGIRDKDLEKKIEKVGGRITTSVSKNTDMLVTVQRYSGSSKEIKAEQLNVKIFTIEEFKKFYKI